ncbi:MAG: hypothetical protein NTX64_09990 [Elusimicrobia bacterium]|nr:hypothetical protein [Elusimicrobiota bacterium]
MAPKPPWRAEPRLGAAARLGAAEAGVGAAGTGLGTGCWAGAGSADAATQAVWTGGAAASSVRVVQ